MALAKPPGVSLATGRRHPEPCRELLSALQPEERVQLEGRDLHLVYRLDRPTSGVVLLAFDRETHRLLSQAAREGGMTKVYLALVWGKLSPPQGVFCDWMVPDLRDRRKMRVRSHGKRAVSSYLRLQHVPHLSWVALFPTTGRTHQLRVQLGHRGHPMVGDDLYGGPRYRGLRDCELRALLEPLRLQLHLWRVQLRDSLPGRFEAPLEPDTAALAAKLGLALPLELWQDPNVC